MLTELLAHSIESTQRVFVGVCVASLLGIVGGILRSGLPQYIKHNFLFRLFVDAPRNIAPIAWIPLVIIIFGIGNVSAYVIVFIGAFFPIFINTFEGAERVPEDVKESAHSMRVFGWKYVWEIAFFSALPQIFTGIRIGAGMGWMSVIAAEMVAGQSGLGYSIQFYRLTLQYDLIALTMVAIGMLGFFFTIVIHLLELLFVPWIRREKSNLEMRLDKLIGSFSN